MTSSLLAARPGPSPAPPGGPAGRYLTNPGGYTAHLARLLLAALAHHGPVAGPLLAVAVTGTLFGRAYLRRRQHAAFAEAAWQVTILAPPQAGPAGAAALWGHLTGLLRPAWARWWHGQPHLGWEYAWAGGTAAGMSIRLWVPGTIPPGLIERAVEAAWPGAHTVTAPARPPLPPGAVTAGGTLRLARPDILPLSTGHDPEAPLRALAGAAAGLADGEHAVLQLLARPVTGARLRKARRAARKQRSGQSARMTSRLLDLASPGHGTSRSRAAGRADPELAAEIRETTAKLAGPQWETLIRYAVATTAPVQARDGASRWERRAAAAQQAARLRGLAHALASATALLTGRNWLARRRLRRPAAVIGSRWLAKGDLLSVPELAAIARLPADPALPGLARAGARAVPPPPAIPLPGPGVRPLGVSDAGAAAPGRPGGPRRPPSPADLRADRHRQDHADRRADPRRRRRRARGCLHRPQGRRRARRHRPPPRSSPRGRWCCSTPATPARPAVPERAARRRVRHRHRHDRGQRHRDLPADLRRVLGTQDGRHLPRRLPDPARLGAARVRAGHPGRHPPAARRRRHPQAPHRPGSATRCCSDFWGWYEEMSPASRAAAVGPLMNKLRAFLLRKFAHAAIAAGPSTFNMAEVLDNGGLCLARLPKGILGEETAQLVGSFIVARTWQAAARRARLPEHARPDAGLYIDECQNFLNLPYPLEDMLAEARAYRLAVTMAHQNLAQLPPDLRQGISRQRPLPGHLQRLPRGRPRPGTPHRPGTDRPRPVPPGRLPGRRPARRQQRRDARLHLPDQAAPAAGPGPGTAGAQGGPRRPQRDPRHARHRPAAQGRRSRPPAAPPHLTRPSRTPRRTPCLPTTPGPAAPAPAGGWPAARSWPPSWPPASPPATGGCCA